MMRLSRLRAAAFALVLVASAALSPHAAGAAWTPIQYTFCGKEFSADPLEYVAEPVLSVFELSVVSQKTTLTPAYPGTDYNTDPAKWSTDTDTNTTHAFVQFLKEKDYLAVMQFTPFVYDVSVVQVSGKNFNRSRGLVFSPPFPMISRVVFGVLKSDGKTPVAAGTEVLFGGWSPDVDPYSTRTDDKGRVLTTSLNGSQYLPILGCLSRFRAGQLPQKYPPIGNPLYVEIPDFANQGACSGWVQIKDSVSTVVVAIKSGVCVQVAQQPLNSRGMV